MPELAISIEGITETTVYRLHKPIVTIGSAVTNDIVLSGDMIPPLYAHIHFDGQTYTFTCESKTPPMMANGRKRKKHSFHDGDKLSFGGVVMEFSMFGSASDTATATLSADIATSAYEHLFEFSERLMGHQSLDTILEELMDSVVEISRADRGFLILAEGDTMEVRVARNIHKQNLRDAVSLLSDSIVDKVIRTKQAVIVSDATSDGEFSAAMSIMELELSSAICVPLLQRGNLLGVVYIGSNQVANLFTQDTLKLVSVFAAQATLIVANAMLLDGLRVENRRLEQRIEQIHFGSIVGTSGIMQTVFAHVEKIAATDVTVLVTGETGTGKELIAREIHLRSARKRSPFVAVNCGAIPESMIESELFGHIKGAFTGATSDKDGKFAQAHGGSLFLDEVGELPLALQVKLLRVLQERIVTPLGATKAQTVNLRIIAATNRDLEKAVAGGQFREDLYYRLHVINVHLPPLSARGDDAVMLARYFFGRDAPTYASGVTGFTKQALEAIRKHQWPGNIRELENRVKRAIILAESPLINAKGLGLDTHTKTFLPLTEARERFQSEYIDAALLRNGGNRTKAAKDLGVDPRTIFRHLERNETKNETATSTKNQGQTKGQSRRDDNG